MSKTRFYFLLIAVTLLLCTVRAEDARTFVFNAENYCIIGLDGKVIKSIDYCVAKQFSNGLAAVQNSNDKWGYMDITGELAVECKYDTAHPFSCKRAVVVLDDKQFVIDDYGKTISVDERLREKAYTLALTYSEGLLAFSVGHKTGFLDIDGKIAVEPDIEVDDQGSFNSELGVLYRNGYAVCASQGSVLVVSRDGKKSKLNCYARSGSVFSEGKLVAGRDNKWGYVNEKGDFLIPPEYVEAQDFSEGYSFAATTQNEEHDPDEYVCIDAKGIVVFSLKPGEHPHPFSGGLARIRAEGRYYFVDTSGKRKFDAAWAYASDFVNSLAWVWSEYNDDESETSPSRACLMAKDGKKICGAIFSPARLAYPIADSIYDGLYMLYDARDLPVSERMLVRVCGGRLTDGGDIGAGSGFDSFAAERTIEICGPPGTDDTFSYCRNGEYGLMSADGAVLANAVYQILYPFSNGVAVCLSEEKGHYGAIDRTGKVVIPHEYNYLTPFVDGHAVASMKGQDKYTIVDITGRQVAGEYDWICLGKGSFAAELDGKWHLYDIKENLLFDRSFANCLPFSEDIAAVQIVTGGKVTFIDRNGNPVADIGFDDAADCSEGRIPVKVNDKWGYADNKLNIVIQPVFDIVTHFSNGVAAVGVSEDRFSGKIIRMGIIGLNGSWKVRPFYGSIFHSSNYYIVPCTLGDEEAF